MCCAEKELGIYFFELSTAKKFNTNEKKRKKMSFEMQKSDTFDPRQTLECGQVFRFCEIENGFRVISANKQCKILELADRIVFETAHDDYFKKYFDFDTNYDIICKNAKEDSFVECAMQFGKGIHILKQDIVETIFSFIISANNHIPRIKAIIERLAFNLGEDMGYFHAFPTAEKMASKSVQFFKDMGAGYRADYLFETAKILCETDFSVWNKLETEDLRKKLLQLKGVGRKVADCVLLFAFSRTDVFPVDTWIKKVFKDEYGDMPAEKLSKLLVEKFGKNSGYVQQWLFFQKRSLENK